MPIKEVECPALTTGVVGACRFCIFTPGGGASERCVDYSKVYDSHHSASDGQPQEPIVSQPILSDVQTTTPSVGADKARKQVMLSMGIQYTVGD